MIAYLDTPSGISGDMFLGCLVDAGWGMDGLEATVRALNWPEGFDDALWYLSRREVMKGPLRATLVVVESHEEPAPQRHLAEIHRLIEGSTLPEEVIRDALAVFRLLAEAEGAVHGVGPEEVHFHEVGAVDSIIDIVGVCAGLHALGIRQLYAGSLPVGEGMTRSQHGTLPLPAPATLEVLARARAPIRPAPGPGELVTPTGAALLAHLVGGRWRLPEIRLLRVGYGAGQKEFEWPNVARLWLGEPVEGNAPHHGPSTLIETNIDDMNPEFYAAVAATLFAHGARDVWWTPIQMKKNRPGVKLSVLVPRAREVELAHLLLRETTTLGMRVHDVRGYTAERRVEKVETPYGPIPVKLKVLEGEIIAAVPEFEACRLAAESHNVPTRHVYEAAAAIAWQAFIAPTRDAV